MPWPLVRHIHGKLPEYPQLIFILPADHRFGRFLNYRSRWDLSPSPPTFTPSNGNFQNTISKIEISWNFLKFPFGNFHSLLQIPARRIPELQPCHGIALWTCFGAPSASDLTACTAFWRLSLWSGGLSMSKGRAERREARTGARSGRRGSASCLMPFRIILRDIAFHFF